MPPSVPEQHTASSAPRPEIWQRTKRRRVRIVVACADDCTPPLVWRFSRAGGDILLNDASFRRQAQERKEKATQRHRNRHTELMFAADFNNQHTSVSNALIKHDIHATKEDMKADKAEMVGTIKVFRFRTVQFLHLRGVLHPLARKLPFMWQRIFAALEIKLHNP